MNQLALQIVLGGALIAVATAVQALFIGAALTLRPALTRHMRHRRRWWIAALVSVAALWMLTGQMAGVWIWTFGLLWLETFPDLEEALYFTLAAYTTLGFGDVLPPADWRILGAVAGANGMLGFGLATAALIDLVLRIHNELRG